MPTNHKWEWPSYAYHSTFSSSAIIEIFWGNAKFSKNYLFEMLKFKKFLEGKIKILVET
jgi:hypothetical protein